MPTRALQFDIFLTPVIDYRDGSVASGWTVYFYAAGTSNAKNVWTESSKTNPYTSYTLSGSGTALLYGDGIYKLVFKDRSSNTIFTWDNVKCQANTFIVSTKTGTYTATPDDDLILVDTSGGSIEIDLETVASFEHPLTIKNIGSNTVTIDPYSTQTIDGLSTVTLVALNSSVILYPDTNATTWRRVIAQATLIDLDGDTKIQVEESSDEDIIRFDIAGTEQITLQDGKIEPTTDSDIDLGSATKEFKLAYIEGYRITSTHKAIMPVNGVSADAKFMLGDSNTILWMYLNTAPPGWKVLSTGADMVLAVAGGAQAYNVNGGNPDSVATWTISAANESSHTHNVTAHNHMWYDFTSAIMDHQTFDSSGNSLNLDNINDNTASAGDAFIIISSAGAAGMAEEDLYTNNASPSTDGGSSHTHAIGGGGTWRPKASVGKLFQLDTA